MPLPTPLLRKNKNAHKNDFGHVLILAGSARMLGAGCLSALAAMRSGAGLCTLAVPKSLNTAAQSKCANMIMTWPLPETKKGTFSASAFTPIKKEFKKYQAIAIGPGLSVCPSTRSLVKNVVTKSPVPLVIDADGLNILAEDPRWLLKTDTPKILTPHPGEMARLIKKPKTYVEKNRKEAAENFARKYNCVLLLKGRRTLVAQKEKKTYVNTTGNVGLATAGSGDVLTGIISALLVQGVEPFEAACFGARLHCKAGDLSAKKIGETSLTADNIIEFISRGMKALK